MSTTTITINGAPYTVDEAVQAEMAALRDAYEHNYLAALNLSARLNDVLDHIRQYRLREQTAARHNTKDM
jgi:hypothetical protein